MRWGIIVVVAGIALWVHVFNTLSADTTPPAATAEGSPTSTAEPAEPTATPTATTAPAGTYVVVAGDSLAGIATRHNVTLERLLAANPAITDPTRIAVGQRIVIPR